MLANLFSKFIIVFSLIVCFGAIQTAAQDDKKPFALKGIFWFDPDTGVEAYLFPYKNLNYRLTVISKKDVKVTYHTSINSIEPVDKELALKSSTGDTVKYFEFEHYFSKMTIWMALEFTVDGKKTPALTRTFYNDIFEVVPNEDFFKGTKN